jgi:predicted translin family RNA/ssDNA-binding protein
MTEEDIVYRLKKRAEIRRQIPGRKSVQEGKVDRIAALLDEAAAEIEKLRDNLQAYTELALTSWKSK